MSYYDNNGRLLYTVDAQGNRADNTKKSGDFYIKSNGETVNGPFDFAKPKTLTRVNPDGSMSQYAYADDSVMPYSTEPVPVHPLRRVPNSSHINGRPLSLSQDFVKHSDGTVERYPRDMQWPAVSGLGDPRRPNGVYMEPPPSSEVPASPALSDEDIVKGILRNEYGTGDDRKNKLLNLGLSPEDIERIQGLVNARLYVGRAMTQRRKTAPRISREISR